MRLTEFTRFRATAIAAAATLALGISGCSADIPLPNAADDSSADGDQQQIDDLIDLFSDAAEDENVDGVDTDDGSDSSDAENGASDNDGAAGNLHPLALHIPADGITPDEFQRYPAACEAPNLDSYEKFGWLTYAIPDTWLVNSRSPNGDLPVMDGTEMTFRLDEGNSAKNYQIELRPDNFQPDHSSTSGWIAVDYDGMPWESFDYDYQIGDDTYRIAYQPVTTVTVADQQVKILVAPQDQAPEALNTTEYVARIRTADVPRLAGVEAGDEGTWTEFSSVISIRYDADSERVPPLTDDIVADIVSSIAMPECARDIVIARAESEFDVDMDGDGHVTTRDEYNSMLYGR